MKLGKAEIRARVPHAGAMCLLDTVTSWDDHRIVCTALNHRDPDHPLRHGGILPAHCAVEYAAQAMAVHGTLAGGASKPRIGFIGSMRDVRLFAARLDDIASPLDIEAVKQLADDNHSLYELRVSAAGTDIMTGRAAVFLQKEVHS